MLGLDSVSGRCDLGSICWAPLMAGCGRFGSCQVHDFVSGPGFTSAAFGFGEGVPSLAGVFCGDLFKKYRVFAISPLNAGN